MKKHIFATVVALLVIGSNTVKAQYSDNTVQRLAVPSVEFFVPHWFVTAHGGVTINLGEGDISDQLSPAAQLAVGYHWEPRFAARLAVSGWEACNNYSYPRFKYKWNFVQPAVDFMMHLAPFFENWKPSYMFDPYALLGAGLAVSFNNDDAEAAHGKNGVEFRKLWHGTRLNPMFRGGLGADFRVSDLISIGAEFTANLMPDHWNSRRGSGGNLDWYFNALVGVKVTLGKSYGRTEPVYKTVQLMQQPVDMPIEKISFNVNIYYLINQSVLRESEMPKLERLVNYLNEHPRAFVRLSGYADKETGNAEINMRISQERALAVSEYLQNAGISEHRIRRFAKGDTVQPFDIPSDNRVCICFVYDPDNPEPQTF